MYIYMSVTLLVPAGPRARAGLRLESSKVDLNRRLSICGGGQSLMSLKVDLDRGLLVCIIHVVVDGT